MQVIIKIAGAGAGKTTTMAECIIAKHKELPMNKNIYCITFTNSAVSCISEKLNEHYGTIPQNIKLSTIHSFLYQDIIKPYYYLLYSKQYERISSIELSYYYTIKLVKEYHDTKNPKIAMKKLGDIFNMGTQTYAKIIQALKSNVEDLNSKIAVSSIDRVKGQEGENCLFILTKDLAPYLFGDKKDTNKIRNRLYVALTRSLDRLSIIISNNSFSFVRRRFFLGK